MAQGALMAGLNALWLQVASVFRGWTHPESLAGEGRKDVRLFHEPAQHAKPSFFFHNVRPYLTQGLAHFLPKHSLFDPPCAAEISG